MIDRSLPKNIIKKWPEILKDVDVIVIPLQYTHSLKIFFKSGSIWDLDVANKIKRNDVKLLTDNLKELLEIYADSIESIDFQLDVERLRTDSIRITNKFFKIKNK